MEQHGTTRNNTNNTNTTNNTNSTNNTNNTNNDDNGSNTGRNSHYSLSQIALFSFLGLPTETYFYQTETFDPPFFTQNFYSSIHHNIQPSSPFSLRRWHQ